MILLVTLLAIAIVTAGRLMTEKADPLPNPLPTLRPRTSATPVTSPIAIEVAKIETNVHRITWLNYLDAPNHKIEYKSRKSDFQPWEDMQWKHLAQPETTYHLHEDVAPGTTYIYRIGALDVRGERIGRWGYSTEAYLPENNQ